jgi:hypothetical protein
MISQTTYQLYFYENDAAKKKMRYLGFILYTVYMDKGGLNDKKKSVFYGNFVLLQLFFTLSYQGYFTQWR